MEEDPTPVPSLGSRKHLITNEDGVITGEETSVDLGHTESGQVPAPGHVYVSATTMLMFASYKVVQVLADLLMHIRRTAALPLCSLRQEEERWSVQIYPFTA